MGKFKSKNIIKNHGVLSVEQLRGGWKVNVINKQNNTPARRLQREPEEKAKKIPSPSMGFILIASNCEVIHAKEHFQTHTHTHTYFRSLTWRSGKYSKK